MLDIGATLKTAREQRGLSLDDVAEATKIRATQIAALEEDAFERLPGPTYARGFIRAYADHLGLDAQALVDEFNARYASAPWEVDDDVMTAWGLANTQHMTGKSHGRGQPVRRDDLGVDEGNRGAPHISEPPFARETR